MTLLFHEWPRFDLMGSKQWMSSHCFVDDKRIIGATEELTKEGARHIAAGIQQKGVQEASRKRRKVDQRNGAWAGHVVYTDMNADRKFTTQKKWDKGIECAK
jgi:hypothetical protein